MKSIVVLFAGADFKHAFDKVFLNESAFSRCVNYARSLKSVDLNESIEKSENTESVEPKKTIKSEKIVILVSPSTKKNVEDFVLRKHFENDEIESKFLEKKENPDSETTKIKSNEIEILENSIEISELKIESSELETSEFFIIEKPEWKNKDIAKSVSDCLEKFCADFAIFAWADLPFINEKLTFEIIKNHAEYKAEYTFADGYPYGVSPEAIERGAAAIIAKIAESPECEAANKNASRDCFFSIMSGDINSFEIETVLAEKDFRLARLEFECSSKAGITACESLFKIARENKIDLNRGNYDLLKLCEAAEKNVCIRRTVPAFYEIQIAAKYNRVPIYSAYDAFLEKSARKNSQSLREMQISDFKNLIKQIADFSENAVISLSLFGEPLLHSSFCDFVREIFLYPGLSLFIETDGLFVTEELAEKTAIYSNGKINWAIRLDATDSAMYEKLNRASSFSDPASSEHDFEKAVKSVSILEKYFNQSVYPQFTRMKINEAQLESFFRFWKNPQNPSRGKLIIQKYDSFCGTLSDEKSADLSPLKRIPCWHLLRDMAILSDGSVLFCKDFGFEQIRGNAFSEGIEQLWKLGEHDAENHINECYPEKCGICDEYYTFNF